MADHLTPQQRHNCMSNIRSKNTKPEISLRKELFRLGYRYRLNEEKLDGKPDIVLAKYRTCIFVNGCFWHGHKGCSKFILPKTNAEFWHTKIENNRERDLKNYTFLESKDWRVIVVWECELAKSKIEDTVVNICQQLNLNRESWLDETKNRKVRREEWKAEIKRRNEESNRMLSELKFVTTK